MLDTHPKEDGNKVRILTGAVCGAIASYIMTQLSLKGVDFETLGIPSEMVKSSLIGTLVGIAVAPKNLVYTLRDGILFIRFTVKTLWDAASQGTE